MDFFKEMKWFDVFFLVISLYFHRARWLHGKVRDSHSGGPGVILRCQLLYFCSAFPRTFLSFILSVCFFKRRRPLRWAHNSPQESLRCPCLYLCNPENFFSSYGQWSHDRLFDIVVSKSDCHPRGPGFHSRLYPRNFSGSIGSGTGSTHPLEDNWVATWYEK